MGMYRKSSPEYRALVVENELDFRTELIYCVEALDAGISVVAEAADFEEALDHLREADIDLLITDINLTDDAQFDIGSRDGTELAKIARDEFDVPAIFLTAFADYDPAVVTHAVASDPIGFLQKKGSEIGGQVQALIRLALRRLELIRRERELARQMEAVVQHVADGLLYIDREGHILDFNTEAATLFERAPDDLLDQYWEDILRIQTPAGTDEETLRNLIDSGVDAKMPSVALALPSGHAKLVSLHLAPAEHRRQLCTLLLIRELDPETNELARLDVRPGSTLAVFGVNLAGFQKDVSPIQLRILMREIQSSVIARARPSDIVVRPSATTVTLTMPDTDEGTGFGIVTTILASVEEEVRKTRPQLQLHAGVAHHQDGQTGIGVVAAALNALTLAQQSQDTKVKVGTTAPTLSHINRTHEARRRTRINLGFRAIDSLLSIPMQSISSVTDLMRALEPALAEFTNLHAFGLTTHGGDGRLRWLGLSSQSQKGVYESGTANNLAPIQVKALEVAQQSSDDGLQIIHASNSYIGVLPLQAQDSVIGFLFIVLDEREQGRGPPSDEEKQLGRVAGRYLGQLLQQCVEWQDLPKQDSAPGAGSYNIYKLRPELPLLGQAGILLKLDTPVTLVGQFGMARTALLEAAMQREVPDRKPQVTVLTVSHIEAPGADRLVTHLQKVDEGLVIFREPHELPMDIQRVLAEAIMTRKMPAQFGAMALPSIRFAATLPRPPDMLLREGLLHERLASALGAGVVSVPELEAEKPENLRWAQAVLSAEAQLQGAGPRHLANDAEQAILSHTWPGNLLEMQERIQSAIGRTPKAELSVLDLGLFRLQVAENSSTPLQDMRHPHAALPETLLRSIEEVVELAIHMTEAPPLAAWLSDEIVEASLDRYRSDRNPVERSAEFLGLHFEEVQQLSRRASLNAGYRHDLEYLQGLRLACKSWVNSASAIPLPFHHLIRRVVIAAITDQAFQHPADSAAVIADCSVKDYLLIRKEMSPSER